MRTLKAIGIGCRNEPVNLHLDGKGTLQGNQQFLPIVRAKGTVTGQTYDIDLTNLFFTDLSKTKEELSWLAMLRQKLPQDSYLSTLNKSAKRASDFTSDFLVEARKREKESLITARNEESGDEVDIVFVPKK